MTLADAAGPVVTGAIFTGIAALVSLGFANLMKRRHMKTRTP